MSDWLEARGGTPPDSLVLLRHPGTIRARCRAVLEAVTDGRSSWFRIDRSRIAEAAARVAALTRQRFPDLVVPPHSRWRHFEAGGIDRKGELDAKLQGLSVAEAARARMDLTIVSVLLDAGAGSSWSYVERSTEGDGRSYTRSEGLGVATFRAFMAGRFSADARQPLRADASRLAQLDAAALSEIFQVRADNPLVGLEGRAAMLARLGLALAASAPRAGLPPRPGQLYDRLTVAGEAPPGALNEVREVSAADLLLQVLRLTEGAFTQGSAVMGRPVGDVWEHRFAGAAVAGGGEDPVTIGVVPFHKLSQWLSYSLLEPLAWAGVTVHDRADSGLTGLPEYRNGGLLLDTGVIVPRDKRLLERRFKPGDEAIVEWRALTVSLLDELADAVRGLLGRTAAELPLASVLEGGTWAAGREIAAERRAGGAPPLLIESDGTVF